MHITKIEIKNFRLLKNVSLNLEKKTTVIVGRNNSGKTSLAELFRRFFSEASARFSIEDFSLTAHDDFWKAFLLRLEGRTDDEIRARLPIIEARMSIAYEDSTAEFGPLGNFVVDLNPDTKSVLVVAKYELSPGKVASLFEGITRSASTEPEQMAVLCKTLKERLASCYHVNISAIDPGDPTNQREIELSKLQLLLRSGFINAQRGLDDETHRDKDVLGHILSNLFHTAQSETADPVDKETAQKLTDAVSGIQESLDRDFNNDVKSLIPALAKFGYPRFTDPRLLTETTLDVRKLLSDNTRMRYTGANGVSLPESFNGLGSRNLIYILLKLLEFFKAYKAAATAPGVHVVFIEEPEAHLHPQMQEVFVRQLEAVAALFARDFNENKPWPVQFVLSTHSSHLANEASFSAIRYFFATHPGPAAICAETKVKDLGEGPTGQLAQDREFLHKYMTLTRCDLLFADKAILIEGATERLLLPRMIEKVDTARNTTLGSDFISVIEVGGAYAHVFFPLLDFLELKTLVVTDLDSLGTNGKKCRVGDGVSTSNACLKHLFTASVTVQELLQKTEQDKIFPLRRIAYEVPEAAQGPCGRSFEDAFIFANPTLFPLSGSNTAEKEAAGYEMAKNFDKTDFALKYGILEPAWKIPTYLEEGLIWLADPPTPSVPVTPPVPATVPAPTTASATPQPNQSHA